MPTQKSLRSPSLRLFATAVAVLGFSALASVSHAQTTAISSWSVNAGTNSSNLNTSSPILGNGTTGSADNQQIYATIPATYTLNIGDSIAFSGNITFTGLSTPNADQFRFGIYDSNGSSTAKNWLGYLATNAGQSSNFNGQLWERIAGNTGSFGQDGGTYATSLQSSAGTPASTSGSTPFVDGDYTFSLAIQRVSATQVTVTWSLSNTTAGVYSVGGTVSNHAAVDQTFTFDRVGFFSGSAINASEIAFSGLGVTYTAAAIPEPAPAALLIGAALSLGLVIPLRRRLRAAR